MYLQDFITPEQMEEDDHKHPGLPHVHWAYYAFTPMDGFQQRMSWGIKSNNMAER